MFFSVVLMAVAAGLVPLLDTMAPEVTAPQKTSAPVSTAQNPLRPTYGNGNGTASLSTSGYRQSAVIKADNRGHFRPMAKLNGQRIRVLVDTGATSVAINESTARRIGIKLKKSDFRYTVSTANGDTKAAAAMLRSVSVNGITIKNVEAAVLGDDALDSVLLGMTYLGRLKKFEIGRGKLTLYR